MCRSSLFHDVYSDAPHQDSERYQLLALHIMLCRTGSTDYKKSQVHDVFLQQSITTILNMFTKATLTTAILLPLALAAPTRRADTMTCTQYKQGQFGVDAGTSSTPSLTRKLRWYRLWRLPRPLVQCHLNDQ